MTPTLIGRIQSRIFLLVVVGIPLTIIVIPVIAAIVGAETGSAYANGFLALFLVALLGVAWEFLYHRIQQYRWEKDWPTLYGLVVGVNEYVALLIVMAVVGRATGLGVFLHFWSLWIVVWLVANGPLRVVLPRWRYRGGRVV